MVSTPASFRLDTLSPFGVSYSATSDGKELALLAPDEGSVYRGRATAGTLRNATGLTAESAEIASLLLGQPPIGTERSGALLVGAEPAPEKIPERDEALLRLPRKRGGYTLIGFARASDLSGRMVPVSFERFDPLGRFVLGARFAEHRLIGDRILPARIMVTAPGSKVSLRYRDIEINPPVEPGTFRIETPEGMRDVPLYPTCRRGDAPPRPERSGALCTSAPVLATRFRGWHVSDCYRPRTSTSVTIDRREHARSPSSSISPATEAPTQS